MGLHLGPQAIDQRSQALDIEREAAEEPSLAPGLLGREAARLIVQRCRGEAVDRRVHDVGFRIVERGSNSSEPRLPTTTTRP